MTAFMIYWAMVYIRIRHLKENEPVPYEIRTQMTFWTRLLPRLFLFGLGFVWIVEEDYHVDYTEYLGENYDKRERVCTLVSNHSSWTDIQLYMFCKLFPGFVSKEAVSRIPLVKTVGRLLD